MSYWPSTYNTVLKNEGGYNRPYGQSGETYKGIDRKHHPTWAGWAIIDQIKASRGSKGIKEEEKFNGNAKLENLVAEWYRQYINTMVNIEGVSEQVLANLMADFLVHKQYDAIKVINKTASSLIPSATTATTVIPAALVSSINSNASVFYKQLRNNRIAYYNNPAAFGSSLKFSPNLITSFVRRVNGFPVAIPLSFYEYMKKLAKSFHV